MMAIRKYRDNRKNSYTVYTAKFQDGTKHTYTSYEFDTRLDVYNFICGERLGKGHGELVEITCAQVYS